MTAGRAARDLATATDALLLELARSLVAAGVGVGSFQMACQRAFVAAAREHLQHAGIRPTSSAIAALTGLTRKAVAARLRERVAASSAAARTTRVDRLVTAWRADPKLRGRPLTLAADKARSRDSFVRLVRAHAGDVPPRAMQRALLRAGVVRLAAGGRIALLTPSTGPVDRAAAQLRASLPWLTMLATPAAVSGAQPVTRMSQHREVLFSDARQLLAVLDRVVRRGGALLDRLPPAKTCRRPAIGRLRVGIAIAAEFDPRVAIQQRQAAAR